MRTPRCSHSRSAIERHDLARLYVDDRRPVGEVALRLGCGATTVRRLLRRFAIPIRPRGPGPGRRARPTARIAWSPELAYGVGLMATDGNLSRDGRHLSIKSKDRDLLETVRSCLGVAAAITRSRSGAGHWYWQVQWGNRGLYDWLTGIGLTPAKSLSLGPLSVPDRHFRDFLRGCIDGDGSIRTYVDRFHASKNRAYVYQRLVISLVSASPSFVFWIRDTIRRLRGVSGSVSAKRQPSKRPIWCLKFGKRASLDVIAWIYHASHLPCLERKRAVAMSFMESQTDLGPGRVGAPGHVK